MDRYSLGKQVEYEPGSGQSVLRNRLRITALEEIEEMETALLRLAEEWSYGQISVDTRFSFEVCRDLHRAWLGSLYDFAGEVRTVNMSKDNVQFAPLAYMETSLRELDEIFEKYTPCENFSTEQLVTAITRVHVEFILIHPFREGNGRLGRWLADLMALQAGHQPLEWNFDRDPQARTSYLRALRKGFAMDFAPLEALVRIALEAGQRS